MIVLLISAVIAGLIVIAFVLSHQQAKQRTAEFDQAASELGLRFFAAGDSELESRLATFPLMQRGRHRKFKNATIGTTPEAQISIFDYRYTTGSGKNSRTHLQTVIAIEAESLGLPSFSLRPEGMLDVVGGVLGFQDIDFDEHPAFSSSFVLKSQNEAATRSLFDASLLDFFATKKDISLEAQPGGFLLYRKRASIAANELRSFFEEGFLFYGALKDRLAGS